MWSKIAITNEEMRKYRLKLFKWFFGFYRILKYKKVEEYNPNKKQKTLTVINMIADMLSNRKLNRIVTELFIRGRKQNISLVFIRQSYFTLP